MIAVCPRCTTELRNGECPMCIPYLSDKRYAAGVDVAPEDLDEAERVVFERMRDRSRA